MSARITLHSTAHADTNEGRLATAIAAALAPDYQVEKVSTRQATLSALRGSDALAVHSPLGFSFGAILLAKLLGRPVTAFVWDLYPVKICGRRYNRRVRRLIVDLIERLALRISDNLIVQTSDFLSSPILARALVIPFWYIPPHPVARATRKPDAAGPLRFAFAGQINQTRGLTETVVSLDAMLNGPAFLHIYSRDPFEPPAGLRNLTVSQCGHLSKEQLARSLADDDIGLVSLHPGFDGPGFPSKSLDYLAAGLPIAYFGPALPQYTRLLEETDCGISAGTTVSPNFYQLRDPQGNFQQRANAFFEQVRADPARLKSHFATVIERTKRLSTAGSSLSSTDNPLEK